MVEVFPDHNHLLFDQIRSDILLDLIWVQTVVKVISKSPQAG